MAVAGELELRLLGPLAVLRDGEPLPLPASRKTRALLLFLAATRKAHRRERLCEVFWDLPDDPRGALRWSLSKLRALLGDAVVADRETVRLELSGLRCDLVELESVGGERLARTPLEDLERLGRRCSEAFGEGLDLPRCDEFQGWRVAWREDVRKLQIGALRQLTQRLASEPERALPYARALVELDPLDRDARLELVRLLLAAGRSEEAARQRALALQALGDAGLDIPPELRREGASPAPAPAASSYQRIQFCRASDGARLAYSCVGAGPPLVKTANWLNHLEFEWESPIWRHWLRALSRDHTLLRYDERGNGLSDWKVKELSFEAFVSDLEAVVAAAGIDRFDLLGLSQGAAVAVAYAARHPERVRRLVLYGGFAAGWKIVASDDEEARRWDAMLTLMRLGWGQDNPAFRQMFTTLFFPAATAQQAAWFNDLQRASASPEGAERLMQAISRFDVRGLLPQVRSPTLVFHARGDAVIPFAAGRAMAARIPGARFVALESDNHVLLEDEPAWPQLVGQLRSFLGEDTAI